MDAYVSQDVLRLLAIGIVAVTAISMGAATIDSTVQLGDPSGGSVDAIGGNDDDQQQDRGGDGGMNEEFRPDGNENQQGGYRDVTACIRPLAAWYGAIGYFGAFGGVLYLIKRRYSFGAAFMGMYALAPVVFLAYFLGTDCASVGGPDVGEGGGGGFGEFAGESVVSPDVSPIVFVGLFGVLLVATAAVLIRASGDEAAASAAEDEEDELDRPDVADLAEAAGAAADRLEEHNADVDNEVYRAWWEMTSLLNVSDPESYTPGEFADEAVEIGMDEDDVSRLTTLFEEVRYGERDAASREERAIEIFRNIESQYGSTGSATEGDDGR